MRYLIRKNKDIGIFCTVQVFEILLVLHQASCGVGVEWVVAAEVETEKEEGREGGKEGGRLGDH